MNRRELLMEVEHFRGMPNFVDYLLQFETSRGKDFGTNFKFSRKEIDIDGVSAWLGKIEDCYFIGGQRETEDSAEYIFFDDKKLLQLELGRNLKNADLEKRGFWMREVESL